MLLPELQAMASSMGIQGVGRLRKGQLIAAIQNLQNGESAGGSATATADQAPTATIPAPSEAPSAAPQTTRQPVGDSGAPSTTTRTRSRRGASRGVASPAAEQPTLPDSPGDTVVETRPAPVVAAPAQPAAAAQPVVASVQSAPAQPATAPGRQAEGAPRGREDRRDRSGDNGRSGGDGGERPTNDRQNTDRRSGGDRQDRQSGDRSGRSDRTQSDRSSSDRSSSDRSSNDRSSNDRSSNDRSSNDRSSSDRSSNDRSGSDRSSSDRFGGDRSGSDRSSGDRLGGDRSGQAGQGDDDFAGRSRRGRFRERGRNRGRGGQAGPVENEPVLREDDVLVPVAGILDVLDNYAFVRTSGYLTGPTDVYVSLAQVRRNGLRRGDAITGVVRAPQEGEQRRDKYNALVRLDTINGMEPDEARGRPEFTKLTPLYPQERLRLETEPHLLTTRIIDLVMPIGKGQRALIVSPPKAGKTMVLQSIANAITTNNPEVHLMVVLVDERPEEVTDMQRSVKGEVVASTFDRPPADHTNVAELSIERAKRLVELGHDVVVLLDSITRLGRAYNLAAPASGRILSGGVDSTALYPPKRFLGAARNIENGGSLTIIATALVETGSTMDTVIFEEFKGTGNAELKLDRKIADKRIFPAVDVDASGTRKEEILLAPEELSIMHKLRRVLHTRENQQALELLLDRLKQSRTNYEFLMQIAKTAPPQD
nr:transcription termination factor Rho [Frankia gtarii]